MSLSVNEIALKACRALLPFDRDKAHDLVCDLLDDYCLAGEFVPAADFLARLSATDDLPVSILVTALTITLPWREQLAGERAEVAGAVRRRVVDCAEAERLLNGLVETMNDKKENDNE